ncbi:signal peptidase I [Actinotalea subterranea]|uniref:signal peptidase I n=1 Tax=Actinotalea subterranea TaxID=2607497 RepID=UPI0011EE98B0|nr:signal peptidase I [Actinotalea subterranea]
MLRVVKVAGESMAPTYRPSDLLLTRRAGRAGAHVRRGDVVVVRHLGVRIVKRVVGLPGDVVELEAGRLLVDGDPLDGRRRLPGAYTQTWRVPAGSCFVVGDNRAASTDSRVWAVPYVQVTDVEAVVAGRLWPGRAGRLTRRRRAAGAGRSA